MVPIPCPGQVQMFTPHTKYLGMGGPGISAKNEKMHHKSAKIAQRKGKRHPSMMYIPCPSQVKLSPPHIVNLGIVCPLPKRQKCILNQISYCVSAKSNEET